MSDHQAASPLSVLALALVLAGCGSAPSASPVGALPASPTVSAAPSVTPSAAAAPTPVRVALPTPPACTPPVVHTVVAGDTLWDIAIDHGTTVAALLAANPQIRDRSLIRPGDRITIRPPVVVLATPNLVVDLATPGLPASFAQDINDAGQVAGVARTAEGGNHAFVWEGGETTDLSTRRLASGDATGINEHGQVVGWAVGGAGDRAFLWENGAITYLPTPDGVSSQAWDINNLGEIAGSTYTSAESIRERSGRHCPVRTRNTTTSSGGMTLAGERTPSKMDGSGRP